MRPGWAWAGLLIFAACSAVAEAAEPVGYVGASVGRGQLKTQYTTDGFTAAIDDEDASYKVFAGARLGVLGLEGGYVDFGRRRLVSDGLKVKVHASGFDAFGTLNWGVGPLTLFAKGGALNWKADATVAGAAADRSGTTAAWGAGAALRLTNHLSIRAEYEKFDAPEYADLHLLSGGVELTF